MFKKMFVCFIILISSNVYAGNKSAAPSTSKSISGYSRANVFGGKNYYGGKSQDSIYSRPNSFGGSNYYNGAKLQTVTRKNSFGGETYNGRDFNWYNR